MGNITYGILKQDLGGITCSPGVVTLISSNFQTSASETYKIGRAMLTAPLHNLSGDLYVLPLGVGSVIVPDASVVQAAGYKYTSLDKELNLKVNGVMNIYAYTGIGATLYITEWHGARNG